MAQILTYNGRPLDLGTNNFIRYGNLDVWVEKTWNGINPGYGKDIWSDYYGNIYYSSGTAQYVLNRATSTWTEKTWDGLTSFYGRNIWALSSSSTVRMYSAGSGHQYYLLNSTWTANAHEKPDDTAFNPYREDIWSNGSRTYYNNGTLSYAKVTYNTVNPVHWNTRKWNNSASVAFYGRDVWEANGQFYFSNGSGHRILDTVNYTITEKSWNGLSYFNGSGIWHDLYGRTFYTGITSFMGSTIETYVLDVSTSTWTQKTWSGFTPTNANYIWTDGYNIYYSNNNNQYVLT